MRRGFFGDEDVDAFVLFVGGEDLLFAVAASGVDFPGVEFGALIRDLRFQAGISMGFTTWIFSPFDERT